MPTFTFIATVEVPITADTLEEALETFKDLSSDYNTPFTEVKEILNEDGIPIDKPLRGGDIK